MTQARPISDSPAQTEQIAAELAARLRPGDVVLVSGELGSGKTTFVRGAARALGVNGAVTSPTYTVGQVYAAANGLEIAHLDLYRLDSLDHEDPALLDDYLTPARIERVVARVRIEHAGGDRRVLEIE